MTDGNYQRHLKVLGKYIKEWQNAGAESGAHADMLAVTCDQVATGLAIDQESFNALALRIPNWNAAIAAGPAAIKAMMVTLFEAYIRSGLFVGTFQTGTPTTSMSATDILKLWAAEFVANSKTLTTMGSDGVVKFLDVVYGSQSWTPAFPTSGSPSYADGTYVVTTIV